MTLYDVIGTALSGAPRPSNSLMRSRQRREWTMACIAQRLNTVENHSVTASSIMGDGILSIVPHGNMALCTCSMGKQEPLHETRGYKVLLNLQKHVAPRCR
jgi:hypothetical protein